MARMSALCLSTQLQVSPWIVNNIMKYFFLGIYLILIQDSLIRMNVNCKYRPDLGLGEEFRQCRLLPFSLIWSNFPTLMDPVALREDVFYPCCQALWVYSKLGFQWTPLLDFIFEITDGVRWLVESLALERPLQVSLNSLLICLSVWRFFLVFGNLLHKWTTAQKTNSKSAHTNTSTVLKESAEFPFNTYIKSQNLEARCREYHNLCQLCSNAVPHRK